MTGARVTYDGTMMPTKTCGGCGGLVVGDAGGEHQIGRTSGDVVNSSGASGAGKQLDGAVQSNSRFADRVWIRVTGGAALTAAPVRSGGTASILRFPGLQGL